MLIIFRFPTTDEKHIRFSCFFFQESFDLDIYIISDDNIILIYRSNKRKEPSHPPGVILLTWAVTPSGMEMSWDVSYFDDEVRKHPERKLKLL